MEQVFISSATYQEVTDKVNILHIQELLKEIDLSLFSEQVKGINFIYIAAADTTNHPEILQYDLEEQTINVHAQLDYKQVLEASEKDITLWMKELFVKQIKKFEELQLDFDREAFEKDIRERFDLLEEESPA